MKRVGNIYEKIYDLDNLRLAHKKAQKDKRLYKEVKMVNSNPDYYLKKVQKLLKEKKYRISPKDYSVEIIRDKTKNRELWKLKYYPHRIIQRAIMLQIEPAFMQVFTDFTCASIRGRGMKRVMDLMNRYLKDEHGTRYCLKIDIQKFYPSVNHKILKKLLRKKFKDKDLLELLDMIIDSFPGKRGLPIGSYLSQFLANYYLAYFDHYMIEKVKCKYIARYMDDVVILNSSKKRLRYVFKRMKSYLQGVLDLHIKGNRQIFPTAIRGIDFVGYRYFPTFRLLRKSTCKKMKSRINLLWSRGTMNFKQRCGINSYIGWMKRIDHHRLYKKWIEPIQGWLVRFYKTMYNRNRYEKNLIKNANYSYK